MLEELAKERSYWSDPLRLHRRIHRIHFGSDLMADFGETVRYGDMVLSLLDDLDVLRSPHIVSS